MQLIDKSLLNAQSSRYVPTWLIATVCLLFSATIIFRLDYKELPTKDLVEWRTPVEGLLEAKRKNQIALLWFTADFCQPCKVLEKEAFADRRIARLINSLFVPIRIDYGNPISDSFAKTYLIDIAFPQLVIVPPTNSLSPPNKNKLKRLVGYSDKRGILFFIRPYTKVGKLGPPKVEPEQPSVDWKKVEDAELTFKSKEKPVFVAYTDDADVSRSDGYLNSKEVTDYVRKNFVAIRLSKSAYSSLSSESSIARELRKFAPKLNPTFIVISPSLPKPLYLVGLKEWYGSRAMLEFLTRSHAEFMEQTKTQHRATKP